MLRRTSEYCAWMRVCVCFSATAVPLLLLSLHSMSNVQCSPKMIYIDWLCRIWSTWYIIMYECWNSHSAKDGMNNVWHVMCVHTYSNIYKYAPNYLIIDSLNYCKNNVFRHLHKTESIFAHIKKWLDKLRRKNETYTYMLIHTSKWDKLIWALKLKAKSCDRTQLHTHEWASK